MKHLIASLLFSISINAFATNNIEVLAPWVNLTPPNILSNAAYMKITNHSDKAISLLQISSPHFGMAHLHETKMEDGVMKMSSIHQLSLPSNDSVDLKPGGLHIMLMQRRDNIEIGDIVEINFVFSNEQKITAKAPVKIP